MRACRGICALGLGALAAAALATGCPRDPVCGNGELERGEACDEGAALPTATCNADCTAAACGDGVVDDLEECDEGVNGDDCDGCDDGCAIVDLTGCGDGFRCGAEECDEGAALPTATCNADCTAPACGDGVLDDLEECDEGAANSDTRPDACRADCRLPACGDEICDHADAGGSCPADCTFVCGDGACELWAGETRATCAADCGLLWWVAQAGGTAATDSAAANGIAALADGSALVTGHLLGGATFGAGEAGETTFVSVGMNDIFVSRYAPDGSLVWAKRAGGGGDPEEDDHGNGIAALADGSALFTGRFGGRALFGPGELSGVVLEAEGWADLFVARYAPDGSVAWVRQAGGTGSADVAAGCGIVALADGSSLVTGYFSGAATFGDGDPGETALLSAGGEDAFIARYESDGRLAWATAAGGTGRDEGLGIAALADGTAVVTGYFNGTATFGGGEPGETALVSAGSRDIFVAAYEPGGSLAWAARAGGGEWDEGLGIAALADGSALVTGHFYGTATFGGSEPGETTLVSEAATAIFVAAYGADGRLAWVTQAGGTGEDSGRGIAALADGSALVTGSFEAAAVFGAGEPLETTLVAPGGGDLFAARYEADGSLAWATAAGGTDEDRGTGIAALPDGTALVTGFFAGAATFGAGEPFETALVAAGEGDLFVARYGP